MALTTHHHGLLPPSLLVLLALAWLVVSGVLAEAEEAGELTAPTAGGLELALVVVVEGPWLLLVVLLLRAAASLSTARASECRPFDTNHLPSQPPPAPHTQPVIHADRLAQGETSSSSS